MSLCGYAWSVASLQGQSDPWAAGALGRGEVALGRVRGASYPFTYSSVRSLHVRCQAMLEASGAEFHKDVKSDTQVRRRSPFAVVLTLLSPCFIILRCMSTLFARVPTCAHRFW